MKVVIQRVLKSSVSVGGNIVGQIDKGFNVLFGVGQNDTEQQADWLAEKIAHLRDFEDENGKMNLSLSDVGGSVLIISQFTLYGDCEKGRRPSFTKAGDPKRANELYQYFSKQFEKYKRRHPFGNIYCRNRRFGKRKILAYKRYSLQNSCP